MGAFHSTSATASGKGRTVHLGGTSPWHIHTPLLQLSKSEIVRTGTELGVPFEFTLSCYQPHGASMADFVACGVCDSCQLRRRAFAELGLTDPIRYQQPMSVAP